MYRCSEIEVALTWRNLATTTVHKQPIQWCGLILPATHGEYSHKSSTSLQSPTLIRRLAKHARDKTLDVHLLERIEAKYDYEQCSIAFIRANRLSGWVLKSLNPYSDCPRQSPTLHGSNDHTYGWHCRSNWLTANPAQSQFVSEVGDLRQQNTGFWNDF